MRLAIDRLPTRARISTLAVDLLAGSPGCESSASGVTCSVSASLPPGRYTANITTYSGPNCTGAILSQGQRKVFRIAPATQNQIQLTLYGVPASIAVTPLSDGIAGSQSGNGFTMAGIWSAGRPFSVTALDASGNAIVGSGAPSFTVTSSNPNFAVGEPTSADPNDFSVTPSGTTAQSTQLTVTASYPIRRTCNLPNASCSTQFSVAYDPFASDDWTTFAHDAQRSGLEAGPTGITTSNVGQLTARWHANVGGEVYGSPIVYDGNVIVVTFAPAAVYDLSAADGSILWHTGTLGVFAKGTPTIDTDDGLVFVGTSKTVKNAPAPSNLYALNLHDGSVAWQTTLPSIMRAAPLYVNGTVYQGWSGGDEPYCVNGGMSALNARTGAVEWTWLTNPITNPGGGGGIWSSPAWDGSHIIFGTGNTCGTAPQTSQGAVALNTDGSVAWNFQADLTDYDNDTGGGVMVQGTTANFINKNGTLYRLNSSTGARLQGTWLGAFPGFGGFATPTTDGSNIIVGAGFFPLNASTNAGAFEALCKMTNAKVKADFSASQYSSKLKAVDASGNVLWSLPMSNPIANYVAVDNGIAFAGIDANVDAINVATGQILWQLPGAGIFIAAPVVVPSGLYAADSTGNVYAASLPVSAASSARSRAPRTRMIRR